jgi:hypothetical protein
MELRRESGSRPPPHAFAPTYDRAPIYRVAHACFGCLRSFKIETDRTAASRDDRRCPGCGGALRWMGRSFAAPKKSDIEQWRKVEALWSHGFRFHSYRSCPDAEPLPAKLNEVADFVRRNPDHPFRVK